MAGGDGISHGNSQKGSFRLRVLVFICQTLSAKSPKSLVQNTNTKVQQGGEKECFPLERNGQVLFLLLTEEEKNAYEVTYGQSLFNFVQVKHISLPALYRLVCREMGSGCKVKVLKMSAQVEI